MLTKKRRIRTYYIVGCYATLATSRHEAIERIRTVRPVNVMRLALMGGIPWAEVANFTTSIPFYQPWLARIKVVPHCLTVDDDDVADGEIIAWVWNS